MSNQQPATSNQQPATSNQQPATSNQQPATSNQQPETRNQQPEQIPDFIARLYAEKRWPELVYIFRAKWNQSGWLYLKRNCNAVERIKKEFTKLTNRPAFDSRSQQMFWNQQIAKYCDRLGVKALIDDMRAAVKQKPDIRSMVYFLHSKEHKPRWEMLMLRMLEQDYKKQKEKDNDAYAAMARILGYEGGIGKPMSTETTPDWVILARKRLTVIEIMLSDQQHAAEHEELLLEKNRINHNLKKHGFQ